LKRAAWLAVPACVAVLSASGCGGDTGDLLAIEVSGGIAAPAQPDRIIVQSDGRATCNGGRAQEIPSQTLLDAREIERDVKPLADRGANYPAHGADQRHYVLRTDNGVVRWAEGERGLPKPLPKAELLTLQLRRQLCG
jgi:hypothetical protein